MTSIEELQQERLRKLEKLQAAGRDPYPAESHQSITIAELRSDFAAQTTGGEVTVAGRVMAARGHGALMFVDLFDGTDRIQGYLKDDTLEDFALFQDVIDIGDFIELTGTPTVTKRGEESVAARSWQMLTKSLRPLPEKWAGVQDIDTKLRHRYLDILMHEETRELFKKKALFWHTVRNFLVARNFLEVETPTLEVTTGGAEATPFKTHHNDFDLDVFLRISVGELWQKRLMAAGYPRTFEIGRTYRNEGSSAEHVQEFTNVEFYAAYMEYKEGMQLTKELVLAIADQVFDTREFTTRGHTFNLNDEWKELDYVDTVREMTGVDVLDASVADMQSALDALGVSYEGDTKERLTDTLWKYCRKQISGPAFVINHPKIVSPLSKAHPDDDRKTERAQLLLAGAEVTNSFSELNDPRDQRARFEEQQRLLEAGDSEAMMPEWEFVEMLEYGMPPTFGFGMGERLFAFLVDRPIREVQIFPLMKPKQDSH